MLNINGRAHLLRARPIKWGKSKKYKMTKMTEMTRNPFHCTETLKLAPHLKPLDYDPWAQFEFKDELTGAEMKEKAALEKKNMAVIERVYQRLKDDKEIQGCIRQIQAHPWMRVVEAQE